MRRLIATTLFTIGFVTMAFVGSARAEYVGNVGLLGGVAILNNSGGSQFTYGAEFNYKFTPLYSLGFQWNGYSPASATVLGTSYSQSVNDYVLTLKRYWDQFNFGVLLGLQGYSSNIPNAGNTSNFLYGLTGGYDFLLGTANLSLGPQVDLKFTSGNSSFTEVDIMAALKYWF